MADLNSGWGRLHISPTRFMAVTYRESIRIDVYKSEAADPEAVQYFYSPALILEPELTQDEFNPYLKKYQVSFKVLMWNKELEELVREALSKKLGKQIPNSAVLLLPIEEIRIDFAETGRADHELVNRWTSYAGQRTQCEFYIRSEQEKACTELADIIRKTPKHFCNEVVVHYSLKSRKIATRTIHVRAEHIQSGQMLALLAQQFRDKRTIYMTADDLNRLILQIATNVTATELVDIEFADKDQELSLFKLIRTLLETKEEWTNEFQAHQWNSVFWNDTTSRPDKITSTLNETYNKSDSHIKDFMKNHMSNQSSSSDKGSFNFMGVTGSGETSDSSKSESKPISKEITLSGETSDTSSSSSQRETEKLVELLTEAKDITRWEGEKFVPKPMQLCRVNLAALRMTGVVTTMQAQIKETTSELRSLIKILDPTPSVPQNEVVQLEPQVGNVNNPISGLISPGTIWITFSNDCPEGWLRCNGCPVDPILHTELFKLVGEHTPNFCGRFPVGRGTSNLHGAPVLTLGDTGGEVVHTLTTGEMPSHTHLERAFGGGRDTSAVHGLRGGPHPFWQGHLPSSAAGDNHPHNNMPPYLAVSFIIKI